MKQKFFWTILVLLFLGIAVWEGLPERILIWAQSDQPWKALLSDVAKNQSLPGPLLGPIESRLANLTVEGVIFETNKHRELDGALPLHMNTKLNLAAEAKLKDMFKQQYFEHESPDGRHPADVISAAGYQFLVVGENLALGNYQNDVVLVEAWMNSPGHRANILDQKFEEIGVAVGKGVFNGQEVWMAVQEFGTPLSKCPSPSLSLKSSIESSRLQIENKEAQLSILKTKYQQAQKNNSSNTQRLIEEYNQLAQEVNKLIEESKNLVERYNTQVSQFNECLENNG